MAQDLERKRHMPDIAFLGLGRMGAAMARRLLAAGHDVVVWNRTAGRADALAAVGASVAASPAAAARGAKIVITMLADPPAVTAVVNGASGVAETIEPNGCLVEMSTIGPVAVRGLASRLPPHAALVDAPVLGSVSRAEAGELRILAGGDPAVLAEVEPVLSTLGSVVSCGPLGSGAALKLVANTAMITAVAGLHEALTLAESNGIPARLAYEVLSMGPLASAVERARTGGGDFPLTLAAKDLDLAVAAAASDLPVASAARHWLLAAASSGAGETDLMSLIGSRSVHP